MKVFIVGIMGSGKSYFGKLLAQELNYTFFDLDHLVEKVEAKKIETIFGENGEAYFRKIESDTLIKFAEENNFVLATGGGTACFYNNIHWMNKEGLTIWLNEPVEIILNRLFNAVTNRPLLKKLNNKEVEEKIIKLLEDRTPYYSKAKIHFTYSENNFTILITTLKQQIRNE